MSLETPQHPLAFCRPSSSRHRRGANVVLRNFIRRASLFAFPRSLNANLIYARAPLAPPTKGDASLARSRSSGRIQLCGRFSFSLARFSRRIRARRIQRSRTARRRASRRSRRDSRINRRESSSSFLPRTSRQHQAPISRH